MSLRLRLLLILAPLFVAGLVVVDVAMYTSLQSFLLDRVDGQVVGLHNDVGRALVGGPPQHGPVPVPQGTYGEIRTADGTVLSSATFVAPDTQQRPSPSLPSHLQAGTPDSPVFLTVPGRNGVAHYRVYVDEADTRGDLLVVAIPLDDVDSTLSRLLLLELLISGGVTLAVIAVTWLLVRRGLRPLETMGATARSIVATDLSRRVQPSSERTEVGRLGLALNTMLAQLESAFAERTRNEQRLRHFVSDASHELRTPLTSMQGYAELLQRNPGMDREDMVLAMRRMEDETRRMGVLVDDLLLLARLDQGRPLERRPVDLEALVADACADARAADPARTVTTRVAAPLVALGDDMRLRQVLGNLLRNALVHTPAGTPVEVELRPEDGRAVVEVIDHGPGIPAGQTERIFERFHRADPGRSRDQGGSGLGLSIVAAVVAAHGGSVAVRETPGGGATFRIELPVAEPAPPPAPAGERQVPGSSEPSPRHAPAARRSLDPGNT